ncbi:MAG: SIR2 family protein [Anaerolineae bacterium]
MVRCFGDNGPSLYRLLKDSGYTLPAIASVIDNGCVEEGTEHSELVRQELYKDFPFFPEGVDKGNRGQFIRYIRECNPTLRAVASLCARRDEGKRTYSPNPLIHAVVSFNVDAVLEAYAYARYEKRILRTIERPSAGAIPGKINVYHMHGYLRFDRYIGDRTKEAPDVLVFTEQEYFDFFNEPNSLFNYTFLYLLREHSCLFIGLSLNDDNIRRLLHYSRAEREHSFQREGVLQPDELEIIRHFAILSDRKAPEINHLTEASLKRLGTRVLWVSDFDEIPERLGKMYEAAGGKWQDVF